jgi:hypothetical protein
VARLIGVTKTDHQPVTAPTRTRDAKSHSARPSRADNTDVATQGPFEDASSDRVVLRVRCAGRNGKCGNIQAEMLEDGTVRYTDVGCHRLPDYFELRSDVMGAYQHARVDWTRAQRSRQPFRPPSIRIRPAPRHAREDQQTRENRERFEAWLERHDPD